MVEEIAVGTAPVNWGFDPLYTWVRPPALDSMLDEMAAAGYAGTELGYNFSSDADVVRGQLRARRLRAASSFQAVDLRDPSRHEQALRTLTPLADRLQALGSNVLILSDEPSPRRLSIAGRVRSDGSDGLEPAQWRALGDGLNRAGEMLGQRGMQAVFHPHVGTFVETRAEIDRLCELTDPALLGLCPDTGHLAYAGVAPEAVFDDYAGRIQYVHLKDVDPVKLEAVRSQAIDFVTAVRQGLFVELGAGMVPIGRILGALRGAGYKGWIIVEQDAPPDPPGAAKRNREYLRREFGL